jgi:HSP20 family protein
MLVRWNANYDPFLSDFRSLQRQMDHVFRDLFPVRDAARRRTAWSVDDAGERYVVTAALPGVSNDDLTIEATEHELTVKGKRSLAAPEGYRPLRRERTALEFAETFAFETALDLEQVEAKLEHGILRIELAKQAKARPRTIQVKAA